MIKKGGWCPTCEQQGLEPKHNRETVLCAKHYDKARRAKQKTAYGVDETAALRARGGRMGWCPDCKDEGENPAHSRRSILCNKHYMRRYRNTEHGRRARNRARKSRSVFAPALIGNAKDNDG